MWPWKPSLPPDIGGSSSNSGPPEGMRKISDSVFSLYEPPEPPDIEIVFVHGVQLSDYEEAHWRTWTAGENDKHGKGICWPMAWLGEDFPRARILSLKYDPCEWSMVLSLEERLVQEMVELADIGQHENCPVVFVCHCIGGLVAKAIVIQAHVTFGKHVKYGKFLQNISGFHFYATPHEGSKLADLAAHLPIYRYRTRGQLVDSLKVLNKETHRLNSEFERLASDHYRGRWRFAVVAETHCTSVYGFSAAVVDEVSARHRYDSFLCIAADHFGVCKPSDKVGTSYLVLKNFLATVVAEEKRRRNSLIVFPSYVVGMESRVKGVCKKLEEHSVVALVGMGGVGKTTLSKCVFTVEEPNFDKHCYLENVMSHKNVNSCQRQLFNALCGGRWNQNESVNFHMGKVKECIMSKKVLLVVDGVGDEANMTALQVPVFNDGNSGSKVVVTTRRRDILEDLVNEGAIIPVDFLSEEEGLDLFSHYAFSGVEESVSEEFLGLAKKIIQACGNLPLSLEAIGLFLGRKWTDTSIEEQRDVWDDVLQRMRKAKILDVDSADNTLRANLMISFEDLSKDEQSIFLDMACILCRSWSLEKGQRSMMLHRDTLEQIWNSIDIQNLTDRSLIRWSDDNTLLIHGQLQDMARAIVMREVDENKSRVWDSEGLNFMLQERVSTTLEGLSLDGVDESSLEKLKEIVESLNLREAEHFDHLRLLNLFNCGAEVVQYYIELGSNELRWAALNGSSVKEKHIQGLGYLRGLQVLNMQGCKLLETLPISIQSLSLLAVLDLSYCEGLKSLRESICALPKLQVLNLYGCISLETLPESIGELSLLMKLDLSFCNKLKSLPESIGKLQKLQELMLHKCVSLEILPKSVGKLSLLTTLDLSYCIKLRTLPRSIAKLRKLQVLRLFSCEKLETLPKGIGKLSLITTLDLSYCTRLKNLPDSIGQLQNLTVMVLYSCESLNTLPASIGKLSILTTLDMTYCEKIKILPESIGGLTKLEVLELNYCSSLEGLPTSIGNLSHLSKLELTDCYDLKHLPDSIGDLIKLQVLEFFHCVPLEKLPISIGKLSLLTTLNLRQCNKLKNLPDSIGGLQNLQAMRFSGYSLEELPASIGDLSLLFELDLQLCTTLKELPESIGKLQNLQVLNLRKCEALQTLPTSVGDLPLLKEVDGYGCQRSLLESIARLKLRLPQQPFGETFEKPVAGTFTEEPNLEVVQEPKQAEQVHGSSKEEPNLEVVLEPKQAEQVHGSSKEEPNLEGVQEPKQAEQVHGSSKEEPNLEGVQEPKQAEQVHGSSKEEPNLEVVLEPKQAEQVHGASKEEPNLEGVQEPKQAEQVHGSSKEEPNLEVVLEPKQAEQVHGASKEEPNLEVLQEPKQAEQVHGSSKELPKQEVEPDERGEASALLGQDMDWRVGDVEEEGGRRPWTGSKHFYNFLVMFFILLEPLSNTVGFLTNYGCFVSDLLLQWVRIATGTSGQQVSSRYKCKVKSKDLTLGSFLGQGCSGMLYEITWSRSQENTGRLARKLFPGVKDDVFESEVVRLFELTDHPNIVKNFCWTVDNRSCSLIMEFVSDNLSNVIRKKITEARRKEAGSKQIVIGTTRSGPFQFPEAILIVVQIAKGIRHLHGQNIYHGDLKPNNVLIDGEIDPMSVKLADFGLVKTKRRTTLVTQRTLCSHMIAWSAPEIVENYISSMRDDLDYLGVELDIQDASSVSHDKVRTKISMEKADTYSFALLCAYVLGGKLWDANLSSNELRKQIVSSGLRPKLPSECPEALASLISSCWDADPERRPSFSSICDELEEIVKDHQREKKGKYPLEQSEETVRQRARPVGGKFDA